MRKVTTKKSSGKKPKDLAPDFLWPFLRAIAVFLILTFTHHQIVATPTGSHLKRFQEAITQDALHYRWLLASEDAPPSAVPVVIDVSKWKNISHDQHTSRALLGSIIDILNERHHKPKAIGIDLEFADVHQTPGSDERMYLDDWKEAGNVKVGIYERALLGHKRWLGWPEYKDMAAGIALPVDLDRAFLYSRYKPVPAYELPRSIRDRIVSSFNAFLHWMGSISLRSVVAIPKSVYGWATHIFSADARPKCRAEGDCLKQLPSILWESNLKEENGIDHLEAKEKTDPRQGLMFGEYVVDYSNLEKIRREVVQLSAPSKLIPDDRANKDDIKAQIRLQIGALNTLDRIVLIGDLEDYRDQFCAIVQLRPLPGVLIHASAITTLNEGIFWEAGESFTFWFEIGMLLLAGTGIFLIKKLHSKSDLNEQHLEILGYGSLAVIVWAISVTLAYSWRVFWPDFVWVCAALFIHPLITDPLWKMLKAALSACGAFLRTFTQESKHGI